LGSGFESVFGSVAGVGLASCFAGWLCLVSCFLKMGDPPGGGPQGGVSQLQTAVELWPEVQV
jgi:hypothetical protein